MRSKINRTPPSGVLKGAGAIAEYLHGDERKRSAIYRMSDEEKRKLGLFHMGKFICGRPATIDRKIAEQEEGGE